MATDNWVNIGTGNASLPGSTKSLPEPMLTYHQYLSHQSPKLARKSIFWNFIQIFQGDKELKKQVTLLKSLMQFKGNCEEAYPIWLHKWV